MAMLQTPSHLLWRQHHAAGRRGGIQSQPLEDGQRPGAAGELHLRARCAARQLGGQDAVVAAALLPAARCAPTSSAQHAEVTANREEALQGWAYPFITQALMSCKLDLLAPTVTRIRSLVLTRRSAAAAAGVQTHTYSSAASETAATKKAPGLLLLLPSPGPGACARMDTDTAACSSESTPAGDRSKHSSKW